MHHRHLQSVSFSDSTGTCSFSPVCIPKISAGLETGGNINPVIRNSDKEKTSNVEKYHSFDIIRTV
jgi:hypothetical protein